MGKTTKQKKIENKEKIRFSRIVKYLKYINYSDMEEWNKYLEKIEKSSTTEEKENNINELESWLEQKYSKATETICLRCELNETCKRRKEKVKTCKFFKQINKESENNDL